ncbi:MAG TPA: hypothetical protein VFN66_06220, partial [Burkholderiales bacterium]|nr:hypothetical protein [Burkholderiales bacterium]
MSNAAVNNYRKYRTLSIILSMLAAFGMGKPSYADSEYEHRADNKPGAASFFETHKSALHDQLNLTPAQEPAWQIFIAKMQAGEHAVRT